MLTTSAEAPASSAPARNGARKEYMAVLDSATSIESSAITTRVEELLGLDFDGFASSVLLAQGRFDLFLKATTKERTGILLDQELHVW